jgi:quercetin dioxygenase-like cupin family protein
MSLENRLPAAPPIAKCKIQSAPLRGGSMLDRRMLLRTSALAVPCFGSVISSVAQADRVNTDPSDEKWYWYPGHLLTVKASGKETGNTCTWMLNENLPREGVPFHKHLYEDESFYVIQGLYEITVGDRTITGGPGTYIYGPRSVPHRWTNMGNSTGRILNVFAPSGIEAYFLAAAIPIKTRTERPSIDLDAFQSRTAPLREKFGIVRTGPLKFPVT